LPQKNGYCPALARDIEITISVYIQQTIAKIAQLVEHDLAPKEWILSGLGKRY
jgi:hypothetical protein